MTSISINDTPELRAELETAMSMALLHFFPTGEERNTALSAAVMGVLTKRGTPTNGAIVGRLRYMLAECEARERDCQALSLTALPVLQSFRAQVRELSPARRVEADKTPCESFVDSVRFANEVMSLMSALHAMREGRLADDGDLWSRIKRAIDRDCDGDQLAWESQRLLLWLLYLGQFRIDQDEVRKQVDALDREFREALTATCSARTGETASIGDAP
jgi:hypothetical protein